MYLEATERPITYQWPGGEIKFEPGQPIRVDPDRGKKILKRCENMVRVIQPDWIGAWHELAELTEGIEKSDPRFSKIIAALDLCDRCFAKDDWPAFQRAADNVKACIGVQP